jgi:hypothetical protein
MTRRFSWIQGWCGLLIGLVLGAVAVFLVVRFGHVAVVGPRGPQGARGIQGASGEQGPQGIPGPRGSSGATGAAGSAGSSSSSSLPSGYYLSSDCPNGSAVATVQVVPILNLGGQTQNMYLCPF